MCSIIRGGSMTSPCLPHIMLLVSNIGWKRCEVHLLKTSRGLFCNIKVVLYPSKRAHVVGLPTLKPKELPSWD
jgi:hypothetical protein